MVRRPGSDHGGGRQLRRLARSTGRSGVRSRGSASVSDRAGPDRVRVPDALSRGVRRRWIFRRYGETPARRSHAPSSRPSLRVANRRRRRRRDPRTDYRRRWAHQVDRREHMNAKALVASDLFGANLTEQGRGPYVALELLALVRARYDYGKPVLPRPDEGEMRLALRSHDFARRLAADLEGSPPSSPVLTIDAESGRRVFDRPETRAVLASLIESLIMPVPGRRKAPT